MGKCKERDIMNFFKKLLMSIGALLISFSSVYAVPSNGASADFSFTLPTFTHISPVTSPVLIANITDRTGNLYAPLSAKFKVITNSREKVNLYLKSNIVTDSGYEESMFEQGGQVYIAFGNLARIPKSSSLANCKTGGSPKDSPGVVAYPVTSIAGAEHYNFLHGKNKYELTVDTGTQYVTVNVGSQVLKTSFAANDPRGFYQAVLSLTEADI